MPHETHTYRYRSLVRPLPRVHVDFNDLDTDGSLYALLTDSDSPLQAGSQVILWDGEGNFADGRVGAVTDRGHATIAMVPGSWRQDEIAEPSDFWRTVALAAIPTVPRSLVLWFQPSGLHRSAVLFCISQAAGKAPETAPPGALEEIGAS